MEAARLFIFETYCRIHHKIDIAMLAGKMDMDVEAAEKWIVDLIRGSQLDAKIDSRDNHVIMGSSFPSSRVCGSVSVCCDCDLKLEFRLANVPYMRVVCVFIGLPRPVS
eukprot:8592-Heterococcus_DN1.PRE.1